MCFVALEQQIICLNVTINHIIKPIGVLHNCTIFHTLVHVAVNTEHILLLTLVPILHNEHYVNWSLVLYQHISTLKSVDNLKTAASHRRHTRAGPETAAHHSTTASLWFRC